MNVKVVEIINDIQCDIGAPSPKIIADEHTVVLFFYLQQQNPDWNGETIHLRNDNDLGVVKFIFTGFEQFKFGSPNDEAANGHPYYEYGLKPYSINLIENSDWIEFLEKQNSVHPYHKKDKFKELSHYIFFFHDTCFEIVCRDYKYELIDERKQKEIMSDVISQLV